jgi:glycine/D-amino acid oxidase-like deaminating enzyme/nitrite reductase/ring-hydroxylating ferredoxin subunit
MPTVRFRPFWQHSTLRHLPGGLEGNAHAEVVVIGAGVAGLTTGYRLAREGRSVMILDDGPVASGETGHTTAHLSCALDDRYVELERIHGSEGARLAAASHMAAIDEIERIVQEEGIRCDFTRLDGFLFNPPESPGAVSIDEELQAAHRAGLVDVERVPAPPVSILAAGPALRFPRQAQIHPLKYMAGLAAAFIGAGGRIHAPTHVAEIRSGRPSQVVARNGAVVTCDHIVVATNAPVNDRLMLASKQAAYRTYVVSALVPRGSVPLALYWDTLDPYHYVRLAPGRTEDRLIIGGEDHKTGQADDAELRYARLEAWARARFPAMGPIDSCWSGQIMEPVDGIAYIGRDPRGEGPVYVATGDSGHGMTHGTIAGLLLNDLIHGRANPWTALYDPARLPPDAAPDVVSENLNELAQYTDWFTSGNTTPDRIARNEGAVVRQGLLKVALYRDAQRKLHACSAICPHLGGVVRWNHGEKSFDCPVHGSRFDRQGKVINGPANQDLAPADPPGTEPVA